MASKWKYSKNLGDNHVGVPDAPKMDFLADVMHANEKSAVQTLKSKLRYFTSDYSPRKVVTVLLYLLPLVATVLLVKEVQRRQSLNSNAGLGTAQLFFQSSQNTLPPTTEFTLLANTSGPVGFLKTELNFDPTKVLIASDLNVTGSPLKRIIKLTSASEANSTGRIEIVLALDPTDVSSAPSGSFELARFTLSQNTSDINTNSELSINTSSSQVVNTDTTVFNVLGTNTQLSINPVETATPLAATPTAISSTPQPSSVATTDTPIPDCRSCQKKRCDGVCSKQEGSKCPDCL